MDFSLVILAGGKGTRLGKLTEGMQKCAITVAGKPFIFHIIEKFLVHQPQKIIIAAGYRSDDIASILHSFSDCDISVHVEKEPQGTGGALLSVVEKIESSVVVVVNGDTFWDFDLGKKCLSEFSAEVVVVCGIPEMQSSSGSIHVDNNLIYKSLDTEVEILQGKVFSGLALFKLDFLKSISPKVCALEEIINKSNSSIFLDNVGRFWDIGTPDGLSRTMKFLEK